MGIICGKGLWNIFYLFYEIYSVAFLLWIFGKYNWGIICGKGLWIIFCYGLFVPDVDVLLTD